MSGYPYEFNHDVAVGVTPEFSQEWDMSAIPGFDWADYDILYTVSHGPCSVVPLTVRSGIAVDTGSNTVTFTVPPLHCGSYRHRCNLSHLATGRVLPVFDGDLVFSTERFL